MASFRAGPRRPRAPKATDVVVLVFLIAGFAWNLAHAAITGAILGRDGWMSPAEDPFGFWFSVVMHAYGLVGLAWLGLSLGVRGHRARKINADLQRRSDDSGQASAIPPRLL